MLAKEGLGLIITSAIVFIACAIGWYFFLQPWMLAITVLAALLTLFNLFFFRDPQRNIPPNPLAVLSPADGRVTQIVQIHEADFFNQQVYRISIFLSVFNVHVNRTPITGRVRLLEYRAGKFLAAFKNSASTENEQSVIGMVDQSGNKVLFKQIAGVIARRIICNLQEGQWVRAGERMGLIRYGSRVDVFLPPESKILVQVGNNVKGGETILAMLAERFSEDETKEILVEEPSLSRS